MPPSRPVGALWSIQMSLSSHLFAGIDTAAGENKFYGN